MEEKRKKKRDWELEEDEEWERVEPLRRRKPAPKSPVIGTNLRKQLEEWKQREK